VVIHPLSEGPSVMTRQRLGVRLFLVAAVASFLLSIALWFSGNQDAGVFVGLWVPSILAAGGFWMAAIRTR
jgi:ABC-type multidrug transport system permease subunit